MRFFRIVYRECMPFIGILLLGYFIYLRVDAHLTLEEYNKTAEDTHILMFRSNFVNIGDPPRPGQTYQQECRKWTKEDQENTHKEFVAIEQTIHLAQRAYYALLASDKTEEYKLLSLHSNMRGWQRIAKTYAELMPKAKAYIGKVKCFDKPHAPRI